MNESQFLAFRYLVHELTGVTISPTKRQMLASRLSRRMQDLNIDSFSTYYKRVTNDQHEREAFVSQVTTHETRFFRTPRVWEYLVQDFLPGWAAEHGSRACKVWSAATSSGEEAYSLAMAMQDFMGRTPAFAYSIDGTDVSQHMIEQCERGIYAERSVRQFAQTKPRLFRRYVRKTDAGYEVCSSLKARLSFSKENLFEADQNRGDYDLVLLRNVLIYFSREDQVRVLKRVHSKMRSGGVLIIGESEYMAGLDHLFANTHPLVFEALDASDVPTIA